MVCYQFGVIFLTISLNLILIGFSIIAFVGLVIAVVKINYKAYLRLGGVFRALKGFLEIEGFGKKPSLAELDEDLKISGYAYDPNQDMFYSIQEPWQKEYGYCRLYDEASAPFGMIVDCEPIYFYYQKKYWLIEFWKGQYDLSCGCEIGVYNTRSKVKNLAGFFDTTIYTPCQENEELKLSFTLKKNGRALFRRSEKHWWLTGFRVGLFSNPNELSMDICIKFLDQLMCNEFVKALKGLGYGKNEFVSFGETVYLSYDKPHTKQPFSRTKFTDALIQKKNKLMCDSYKAATEDCLTIQEKLKRALENSPFLSDRIENLGKPIKLYKSKV